MMSHPCISVSKVKFVSVSAAGNGNNTLIAAGGAGVKIRVLAFSLTMTGTAVTIAFQDGAGGTALTGTMTPTQGQTIPGPFSPVGLFEGTANTLLNLSLGGAQTVAGYIVYQLIGVANT